MKKITKIMLSDDNDLLNDNEMKRIYGGYSTSESGYSQNCTCKVVVYDPAIKENVVTEQKPDVICSSADIVTCCQSIDKKYNQLSCFPVK